MDTINCIQDEIWELYSKGQLMPVVLVEIEKHCQSCEICSDIKEGIDSMENPSRLMENVELLKSKTTAIGPKSLPKNNYWYASAAAIFLMAVGLSWYLFKDSKEGLVIQNIPKQILIDTINLSENKVLVKQDSLQSESKENLVIHSKPQRPKGEEIYIEIEDNFKVRNMEADGKIILDTIELVSNYEVKSLESEESDAIAADEIATASRKEKVSKTITSQSTTTIPYNLNNSSPEILNLPDNFLKNSYHLDSANFSKASNYYKLNVYDSSLTTLEPIIGKGYGEFYEDAMLMKAQILVNQGKPNDAIPILQKLIYLNGKKAKLAKTRLKQIQSAPVKD